MYGSYHNQDGTTVHAPWKLASCLEEGGMCLIKRLRPGLCPCEHNAFALSTQNDPQACRWHRMLACSSVLPTHHLTASLCMLADRGGV